MGNDENAIIIGIDFGTTFSGVSWAYSGQPTEIEVISSWESKLNLNSDKEKAPSTIHFEGKRGAVSWGYGISPKMSMALKLVKDANKDPVEVISAYLLRLWNHAVDGIITSAGNDRVNMCRFHVVITLPAIWSDYAKARMRRAAENAGLLQDRPAGHTTLAFVTEPEAAAMATMKDKGRRPNVDVGDHIVVCDAGGGTVDLISYEMLSKEPVTVREAVKGEGDLCGGVFLDEAFLELIKRKVTSRAWDNVPCHEAKKLLNDDWENGIKTNFNGQDEEFTFGLSPDYHAPGTSRSGMKRKRELILDRDDLLTVFNPVIDHTVAMVKKQIDGVLKKTGKKPKKVILVGGFGRCSYLKTRLEVVIGEGVDILQSQGNKPAISRGAVLHGLAARNIASGLSIGIKSRISRMSYGMKNRIKFIPYKHNVKDRVWAHEEQQWKAKDQMDWLLKKGTDVSIAKPVRKEYYRLIETSPEEVSQIMYSTSAWPAPGTKNKDVHQLCTIKWSKDIDFESLPRYTNPAGKIFAKLVFIIEMTCSGSSVDFTVIHDGKQVGAQNVSVVFKTEDDDI